VTGYDTIMPLYRLEKAYLPDVARIAAAVKKTLEFQ
jgi:2-oxoisovalerate dehydrogenase E1 component beta subunit